MRFLGSKFTQNALAAGAKALPRPLADFRGPLRGRGKGKERKEGGGKGERGIGKGKREGRAGQGIGEKGKEEGGGKGRGGEVCVIGIRGDRRPWSMSCA